MVHYATFHLPVEPDGFYCYNPLQQLAYAGVVFAIAPVSLLTGLAMSPAIDNRFLWYPRLFGGRQKGAFDSFSGAVRLRGVSRPARHDGRDYRVASEYEPYRDRHG